MVSQQSEGADVVPLQVTRACGSLLPTALELARAGMSKLLLVCAVRKANGRGRGRVSLWCVAGEALPEEKGGEDLNAVLHVRVSLQEIMCGA